jgi:hypothetical protein
MALQGCYAANEGAGSLRGGGCATASARTLQCIYRVAWYAGMTLRMCTGTGVPVPRRAGNCAKIILRIRVNRNILRAQVRGSCLRCLRVSTGALRRHS